MQTSWQVCELCVFPSLPFFLPFFLSLALSTLACACLSTGCLRRKGQWRPRGEAPITEQDTNSEGRASLCRAVLALGMTNESVGWSMKRWASAITDSTGVDFQSQPGLKALLKDVILALAENPSMGQVSE